ncbi:MAG: polyprenyl synthetase family protein [Magnetococcales bacterium]|nr:polyprenyl synthetase family protein [Magnetococcales bacterium]MBF0149645.1 polyprenyl synthetase family protein [Magnetococcales bacterium]MBF0172491.1 polyprenyl synthetase family protein [Magnetococcales bacterium]
MDLKLYLQTNQSLVDKALSALLPGPEEPPQRLNQAIRHSLLGGGKRLRPILILACADAVGTQREQLLAFACGMECLHTYSLIHDDLPAMDDDDLRRGRPTCHKQFDEATAILAGDALLTYAFDLASRPIQGISADTLLMAVRQLAHDAGIFGMVGGQMMDLLAEHRKVDLGELRGIHRLKTGALIRCACECGARLGGGTSDQIETLKNYGAAIGLAFQITDDLLDVTGDSQVMGKATGKDEINAKSTYPSLMGIEGARHLAQEQINLALSHLESFSSAADPLRDLARYIIERTH